MNIFVQLCLGLNCLHRNNIMHRDLKPENIICFGNGIYKLADFGMAKQFEASMETQTKTIGTEAYNAPEVGKGRATFKSDVFSLGLILYYML